MTYCLAINTDEGLVFCSDSRTNAGFDNVSTYSKMHTFVWPGDRFLVLLSAGNLATTQSVIKRLNADLNKGVSPNLLNVASMHEAADYVASVSTEVQRLQGLRDASGSSYEATFILGGQIGNAAAETLLVYAQGNYIHESNEHPFLQIGEIKYGKPILDRVIKRHTQLEAAARCALVSMNSTMRSNLTVGSPVDVMIYSNNSLSGGRRFTLTEDDAFAKNISQSWNTGLTQALDNLPRFPWEIDRSKQHD
jgi:putative proteasome-type protease